MGEGRRGGEGGECSGNFLSENVQELSRGNVLGANCPVGKICGGIVCGMLGEG